MKSKKRATKQVEQIQEKLTTPNETSKVQEKPNTDQASSLIQKIEQKPIQQKLIKQVQKRQITQKYAMQKKSKGPVVQPKPIVPVKVVEKKQQVPTKPQIKKPVIPQKPPVQPIQPVQPVQPVQQIQQVQQVQQMNFPPQAQFQVQNSIPAVQTSGIAGGFYGRRQHVKPVNIVPDIFNDDQPLIQRVKQQKKQAKITIQIKAQRSMAKLKQKVDLPAMCSLTTDGGSRTSVDLICVIDVSGSMQGQKINLVQSTMRYLFQTLTPSDRLSIITFESVGQRVCGLKCMTPQNAVAFERHVTDNLFARGGTNINSGLSLALRTMKQRKHVNNVTSIFLLSDGQDKGAEVTFKSILETQGEGLGVFSIHSFGFGTDHDEDLMTKICQIKDGSFYFIKELATLDEAFCNALGGIISLVATDVVIKLTNISKNLVQQIKIKRTYGNMWHKQNDKQYKIKILQLMSGISKDYVFQIQIPHINTEVGDLDRDHDILQAIYTAKGVDNSQMSGQCCFKLTLLNENQQIPQINQNIDVIENYLRVKASEVIEQNMKKAENQHYQEAQQAIDVMINCIQSNKKARKQKMQNLVNDLQNIRQKCSKQQYQQEGKKWMKSAQMAHVQQNNYAYSNKIQQDMVIMQKSKKSKF